MQTASFELELARERRARLAAERLLEQKQAELMAANRKLSQHALSLSGQIVDQRKVMQELQGQNSQVSEDLLKANNKVVVVERLLWDALETIQDGFALFDADLKLIAANSSYLNVFEEAENVGPGISYESILDLCLDEGMIDLGTRSEDEWYDFMLDRWDEPHIEPITLRLFNGIYVKMMDRRTADGGVVSLALNITDTIRRETELMEARDKALAADRAKSAFLAKMSHELRTPMNGVVGMADLLIEGELDEENLLYANTIKTSGEALLDIINDVLDFSKIEAERLELKPRPFDLERLVQDITLLVEPSVQKKNVELTVDYDQFLPTEFIGDAGRIRQILVNLVGNAVKFTEQGYILIRVVGLPHEDSGSYQLHIAVEDSGFGIEKDMIEHVFGEFNQIEDEANRKFEGTGLGLAITRKLVACMGGDVWLDSNKGDGSCFGIKITLPTTDGQTKKPAAIPQAFKTALIIEPNNIHRKTLIRHLNLLGLDVLETQSLAEAQSAFEATLPDVVFIAHGRNALDGTMATAELRASLPGVPTILMALPFEELQTDPGYVWLNKPILRQDLFEALLEAHESQAPRAAVPEVTTNKRRLRVLAAEDNKTNQLVFRKMLKELTLELTLVNNGIEAVDAFKNERPDLIFMDISMPEMDGMEATQQIRWIEDESGNPPVPIIAMTAHAMDGDEARIREKGLDHYLTKPLKKTLIHELLFKYAPDDAILKMDA